MSESVVVVSLLFKLGQVYLEGKHNDSNGGTKYNSSRGPAVSLARGTLGTNIVTFTIQSLHLIGWDI